MGLWSKDSAAIYGVLNLGVSRRLELDTVLGVGVVLSELWVFYCYPSYDRVLLSPWKCHISITQIN